jgi:hypothetical protein
MKTNLTLACAAFALLASPAAAATFTTLIKANNQTCALESNATGTTSTCNGQIVTPTSIPAVTDHTVTARADPGSVGVAAQMRTVGDALDSFEATASVFDTLFFGVDSGSVSVSVDVAGSLEWALPPLGNVSSNTFARTRITTYLLSGFNFGTLTNIYEASVLEQPWSNSLTTETKGSLGTTTLSFAFSGGSLNLAAVMTGDVWCRSGALLGPGSCSASVDFLNSLRFTGARVFDTDGNAVATTITSASGFDYAKGLPPHGGNVPQPSVIPLPASALLLPAGLGLMAALRRRRRAA